MIFQIEVFFIALLFKTDFYTIIHRKVLSHAGKVFEYKDIPSMNKELNINKSTPYTSGGGEFFGRWGLQTKRSSPKIGSSIITSWWHFCSNTCFRCMFGLAIAKTPQFAPDILK